MSDEREQELRKWVLAPVYALVSCPGPESCVAKHVNEAEKALDELCAYVRVSSVAELRCETFNVVGGPRRTCLDSFAEQKNWCPSCKARAELREGDQDV